MEEIYSEEELIQNKPITLGQWKFSMPNEEIERKLASLPKLNVENKDCELWTKLFSFIPEQQSVPDFDSCNKAPDFHGSPDIPMEHSLDEGIDDIEPLENYATEDNAIDELTICLVDLCNQVAPKLKQGLSYVQEEMKSFTEDMSKESDNTLNSVMLHAWSQLNSEASKLCFCVPFSSSSQMCKNLCELIIKPWLTKSPPSKMEQLSAILSAEGEAVCLHLVAPLLQMEDSILSKDTLTLEDLMASMMDKNWTALLREILKDLRDLQKWQIPSLAIIVENAKLSSDEVHLLIQIMSSLGTSFAQSRDFGALLVAVANSLCENSIGLVSQLKLIANNYKGPLKFKVLKILDEVENNT